ncbi:protein tyrosine phosphatase [Inquilinus sp. KBS0705]|nr:protein tyrosine phosphatase [Inquilinus sp. KBS0705]
MSNLLFICSKNQWRSPTAELLFKGHVYHNARSAGTSDKSRIKVNQKALDWADVVFVMENKHRDIIKRYYQPNDVPIIVLDIEDNYAFNDPELVQLLKDSLQEYL